MFIDVSSLRKINFYICTQLSDTESLPNIPTDVAICIKKPIWKS
jgi:hypothetical protein